ncbi:MAG: hypothetical protein KDK25_04545 [Leptospiraceae bacterium]|nr:hypothetical protein [Leptospiraceae bacterium]
MSGLIHRFSKFRRRFGSLLWTHPGFFPFPGAVRRIGAAALTSCLLITLLSCQESPEEIILRLEQQIQAGKYAESEKEIRQLIQSQNQQHSTTLSEKAAERIFAVSLDHTAFAWYENGILTYRTLGIIKEVGLPQKPDQILLSYSGKTALAEYRNRPGSEGKCSYDFIQIIQGEVKPDVLETDCENTPAVTDTGDRLYFSDGKHLFMKDMSDGKKAMVVASGAFKEKFKKVKNRFHIASLPGGEIWIFYGEGGFYNLYHYKGSGRPDLFMEGVASPRLFGSVPRDFLSKDEAEQLQAESLFAGDPAVFLYTGAAGNYKLQLVHLPDQKGPEYDVGIREDMFYVTEREEFLLVRKNYLCYLNPVSRKYTQLPLEVEKIFVYSEGVAYVDPDGKLLLRSRGFSDFEKNLHRLKEEVASESR